MLHQSMIRKKLAPDLIRGVKRLFDKIMPNSLESITFIHPG